LTAGSAVNLEKSVTPTTRLGGHLVSGHVDGIGEVIDRSSDGRSERFVINAPDSLARYIAEKGSICVDGISLTVNGVAGARFDLNIVPHTLAVTTMGRLHKGDPVNLEVDVVARYLERLMQGDQAADKGGITQGFLKEHGFA
jgi:riboflavin synthase